jgi:N-methylhydantoinase A
MVIARPRRILEGLGKEGQHLLAAAGVPEENRVLHLSADLLYANQVHALTVPLEEGDLTDNWPDRLRARFEQSYRARYGFQQPDQPLHARAFRLAAIGLLPRPRLANGRPETTSSTGPTGMRPIYLGEWVQATIYRLEGLMPDERFSGPVVVDGDFTTVLLPPDCEAEVDPWGGLVVDVR